MVPRNNGLRISRPSRTFLVGLLRKLRGILLRLLFNAAAAAVYAVTRDVFVYDERIHQPFWTETQGNVSRHTTV